MGKPNVFKTKIAAMGITSKEMLELLYSRGLRATAPELSLAIHGGTQPKHRLIRDEINEIYDIYKNKDKEGSEQ